MNGDRKQASFISIATAVGLVTGALAGGMWLGAIANEVDTLQVEQLQNKEDHDRLIKVEEKVDNIEEDVAETKEDVKEILKAIYDMRAEAH